MFILKKPKTTHVYVIRTCVSKSKSNLCIFLVDFSKLMRIFHDYSFVKLNSKNNLLKYVFNPGDFVSVN